MLDIGAQRPSASGYDPILLTSLKRSLTAAPGGADEVEIGVQGLLAPTDNVRLSVEGDFNDWATVTNPIIALFGERVHTTVTLKLPGEPSSCLAGLYSGHITAVSVNDPKRTGRLPIQLTVQMNQKTATCELRQRERRDRQEAIYTISVTNQVNAVLHMRFRIREPKNEADCIFEPTNLTIQPDGSAQADIQPGKPASFTLRVRARRASDAERPHDIAIAVEGEFVRRDMSSISWPNTDELRATFIQEAEPKMAPAAAPSAPLTLPKRQWPCPNPSCDGDNPPTTKFCLKCGAQLLRECPECSHLSSLVATGICRECGMPYRAALRRAELRMQIAALDSEVATVSTSIQTVRNWSVRTPWAEWTLGAVTILFILLGMVRSNWWLAMAAVYFLLGAGVYAADVQSKSSSRTAELQRLSQLLETKSQELGACQQEYDDLGARNQDQDFRRPSPDARNYTTLATSKTPALIVYLLDVSASMQTLLNGRPRIEIVGEALQAAIEKMIFRSTKGSIVSPRYRIAMFAYSDGVEDLLGGVKTVDQVARIGLPRLATISATHTAQAFAVAEKLLQREMATLGDCPAPVICHMTDGEYNGSDPEPVVRRILQMRVPDGNVLVENIFVSDRILSRPIGDPQRWQGVFSTTNLASPYAAKLLRMSSLVPESYRATMGEYGYDLAPGALMLFPGMSSELVAMAFQMSAATPVR